MKLLLVTIIVAIIIPGVGNAEVQAPVTLIVEVKYGIHSEFLMEEVVPEFEKMMKDSGTPVAVRLLLVPAKGYTDKVTADFAAGVAGDVVYVDSYLAALYAVSEFLLDLTPYVEEWLDWNHYYPAMKAMGTYKEKVWVVIWDSDLRLFYYRKDLFEQAGILLPWQPRNWGDIKDTCKTLKEKLPNVVPIHNDKLFEFLGGAGGRLYDLEDKKWITESPQLLQMFEFYYQLYHIDKVSSMDIYLGPKAGDVFKTMLKEGEVAIIAEGSWYWDEKFGPGMAFEIPNRDEVLSWAMFPGSGSPGAPEFVSMSGGYSWAINAKTAYPDIAWKFLKFVCNKEHTAKFCARTSHIVPRADAIEVPEYTENEFIKHITKIMEYTTCRPVHPDVKKVMDCLGKVKKDYLYAGTKTPTELMEEFAKLVIVKVEAENVKTIK